jgi:copper chaperone CopZ
MLTIGLMVGGMRCRHCVREVTSRLRDVPGVNTVTANADRSMVRLSGTMSVEEVLRAVRGLGYPVHVLDESTTSPTPDRDADRRETAGGQEPPRGS